MFISIYSYRKEEGEWRLCSSFLRVKFLLRRSETLRDVVTRSYKSLWGMWNLYLRNRSQRWINAESWLISFISLFEKYVMHFPAWRRVKWNIEVFFFQLVDNFFDDDSFTGMRFYRKILRKFNNFECSTSSPEWNTV